MTESSVQRLFLELYEWTWEFHISLLDFIDCLEESLTSC